MNVSSPHGAPGETPTARESGTARHDEILRSLDRLALRTAARARSRVRARVAAGTAGSHPPQIHAEAGNGIPSGPLTYDDSSTAPPSQIAVLPELPGWISSVLSVMRGSSSVLRPERGPDGSVRDYTVVGANHHELSGLSIDPADCLGRLLSEVRPGARTSGMYDLYAAALAQDGPVSTDGIDYFDVVDGTLHSARLRGTVTPLAGEDLLLTNWVPVGESRIGRRIQESSRMGWAEWDLVTGKVQWSAGMREVLGLSAEPPEGAVADGSMPTVASARDIAPDLLTIGRMIDTADLPPFEADVRRLLAGEEINDREVTMRIDGEERRVRWIGYARPAGAEGPESVLFAARDITEQERALRTALSDAARSRQEAAAERRVSETLRAALTPPLPAVTPSWLSVGAAYVPSDHRIGGDWYKCRELSDGRVLVAVGDASGHGVEAASRAVQQRSALAGLAYTDGDPGQLATALGEVVFSTGLDTTATAVIGHLDPTTRVFRWASAGHPSPILVRDNVPHVLDAAHEDAAHGLMFGVEAETAYPVNTTRLADGDLLLLYTDGVVERRGHDLDSGVASLLEAVVRCAARGTDARAATDCLMATLLGPEAEDDATILALHVA